MSMVPFWLVLLLWCIYFSSLYQEIATAPSTSLRVLAMTVRCNWCIVCHVNNNLSYLHHMVSDSVFAVGKINDAAAGEAEFLQRSLHGQIVPVGIDAQIGTLGQRPTETRGCNAVAGLGNGDAVDHAIRLIIAPLAVINCDISWINVLEIAENSGNFLIFQA